jgi:hypothetical protein
MCFFLLGDFHSYGYNAVTSNVAVGAVVFKHSVKSSWLIRTYRVLQIIVTGPHSPDLVNAYQALSSVPRWARAILGRPPFPRKT